MVAATPLPIAQIGSYAITTFEGSSKLESPNRIWRRTKRSARPPLTFYVILADAHDRGHASLSNRSNLRSYDLIGLAKMLATFRMSDDHMTHEAAQHLN